MTIQECKKRKKELKQMLANIETLKLALLRSIAIEDMNIAEFKKEKRYSLCNGCKYSTDSPLCQRPVGTSCLKGEEE